MGKTYFNKNDRDRDVFIIKDTFLPFCILPGTQTELSLVVSPSKGGCFANMSILSSTEVISAKGYDARGRKWAEWTQSHKPRVLVRTCRPNKGSRGIGNPKSDQAIFKVH